MAVTANLRGTRAGFYADGIPENVTKQIATSHRGTILASAKAEVSEDSLVVNNSMALIAGFAERAGDEAVTEVDTSFLAADKLSSTLDAFRAEVARQFQTTPQLLEELNRMFVGARGTGTSSVLCWTEYGLEKFQGFYTNYMLAHAGNEVAEFLPRLEHATVPVEADVAEGAEPEARRVFAEAFAPRASGHHIQVPLPGEADIDAGSLLTGLAKLPEGEDISVAAWDDARLGTTVDETISGIRTNASQFADSRTLRLSNTRHHITLPRGGGEFVNPEAVRAFQIAVMREAGEKILGTRELGQMFAGRIVSPTNKQKILAWTAEGIKRFQIFLPRYIAEKRRAAGVTESAEETATTPEDGTRRTLTGADFDGARERRQGTQTSGRGDTHRSSAREATRLYQRHYPEHMSDRVYTFNAENHLTLDQITQSISKELDYPFTNTQISMRINNAIREFVESLSRAPKDIYLNKVGKKDDFEIYYTEEALNAARESIIKNPPSEYVTSKSLADGSGITTDALAGQLGVAPAELATHFGTLLSMLPPSLRAGVQITVAPSLIDALERAEIIAEGRGIDLDKANEVYGSEGILKRLREHFETGEPNPETFNEMRQQYLDLGHETLPLHDLVLRKPGRQTSASLAWYDLRQCDLSGTDFRFCDISDAITDETTVLQRAMIDNSTVATPAQRELHRAQQVREIE